MLDRRIYSDEHLQFKESVKKFIDDEIAPNYDSWERDGRVPKSLYLKAGQYGLLCAEHNADFLYSNIVTEELNYRGFMSVFFALHSDIVFPYIANLAHAEKKSPWVDSSIAGRSVLALALTEPDFGSDLAQIKTRGDVSDEGIIINGSKTFVSNGQIADLFVVAVRTNQETSRPHDGISLVVVEGDNPGLKRGRNLEKIGLKAQDTSELFFEDCKVPRENLLGEKDKGFSYLMENLQQERLVIAIGALAAAKGCLDITKEYIRSRSAFGKKVSEMQNTKFAMAEMETEIQIGQSFLDDIVTRHIDGENLVTEMSMAKYWITDLQGKVADHCLQLHGGYGFMTEYLVSRYYADARVQRIYGGTNEIMKELIARNTL